MGRLPFARSISKRAPNKTTARGDILFVAREQSLIILPQTTRSESTVGAHNLSPCRCNLAEARARKEALTCVCVGALYLRDNDEHLGDLLGVRGRYTPPTLPFARGRLSDDARRLRPLCAKERERGGRGRDIYARSANIARTRRREKLYEGHAYKSRH